MPNSRVFGLLVPFVSWVAADVTPLFKITTKRDNDRVNVKVETDERSSQSAAGLESAMLSSNARVRSSLMPWSCNCT